MTAENGELVLSKEAALEVLAFLVTAARTQTEEAAEYGPIRLLMGAQLLAQRMAGGVRTVRFTGCARHRDRRTGAGEDADP